jgi:hypothetical protein
VLKNIMVEKTTTTAPTKVPVVQPWSTTSKKREVLAIMTEIKKKQADQQPLVFPIKLAFLESRKGPH